MAHTCPLYVWIKVYKTSDPVQGAPDADGLYPIDSAARPMVGTVIWKILNHGQAAVAAKDKVHVNMGALAYRPIDVTLRLAAKPLDGAAYDEPAARRWINGADGQRFAANALSLYLVVNDVDFTGQPPQGGDTIIC